MKLIIQILMLFIVLNCILKLSFWKYWQALLFGVVCGVFIIAIYPQAILQSKTQIADLINNKTVMQNMAVLITLDSALCFAFCFTSIKKLFGKKIAKWAAVTHWYVSLLLFPVLFFVLTQLMFSLSGIDFSTIAWGLAIALSVLPPVFVFIIKRFLPEKEFRLEIHFLVSIIISILGLISTVNGNVTYTATQQSVDFKAIIVSMGLFVVVFVLGYVLNKRKWIQLQKKDLHKKQ